MFKIINKIFGLQVIIYIFIDFMNLWISCDSSFSLYGWDI